jgi:hypothetical protein
MTIRQPVENATPAARSFFGGLTRDRTTTADSKALAVPTDVGGRLVVTD